MGGAYGWMSGWVAICAYAVANTTIAYLGAPWALALVGIEPTPNAIVVDRDGARRSSCAFVGALGIDVLGRAVRLGIVGRGDRVGRHRARAAARLPQQDLSIFTHTLGAEALSGGSVAAGMLAALAVGGWVFIGFDACVAASEETRGAARHVPRAIWIALLSVARARHPQRGRGRRSRIPIRRPSSPATDLDPVDHGGRHLVRLVVGQAVRRGRARRVPRLRRWRRRR